MSSFTSKNYELIQEELKSMVKKDQAMRQTAQTDQSKWNPDIDRVNTQRLKEIVAEIGWPTVSKVGDEVSHGAWLLVQHADHDIAFQRLCLDLMKKESADQVAKTDIAYLEDRVLLGEGKSQLYGTQFRKTAEGVFGPRPIENEEGLEERRKLMGLEPFSDYRERMEKTNRVMGKN